MTGPTLCAIPGCRLRGRHLPGCQDPACPVDCDCHNGPNYPCSVPGGCGSVGCGTPANCDGCLPRATEDGLACDVCVGRTAARLEAIIELTPDARLVAAGLVRRGGGHASGKPQSRPPLNDGATDVLDAVQSALTTLARDIAETRGITIQGDREDAPSGRPRAPRSAGMGSVVARVGVDAQGGPEARTDERSPL